MAKFAHFQDNFKKRYDAIDKEMFDSCHLRFNFDDELNSVQQATAFVNQVCKPILVSAPASPNDSKCTDEDLFTQTQRAMEEEEKKGGAGSRSQGRRSKNRRSSKFPFTESGSSSSSHFMPRTVSKESDSKGSSGSRSTKQGHVSLL